MTTTTSPRVTTVLMSRSTCSSPKCLSTCSTTTRGSPRRTLILDVFGAAVTSSGVAMPPPWRARRRGAGGGGVSLPERNSAECGGVTTARAGRRPFRRGRRWRRWRGSAIPLGRRSAAVSARSASARLSSSSPRASLPNSQAVGSASTPSARAASRSSPLTSAAITRSPAARARSTIWSSSPPTDDRQVEERTGRRAHDLRVVQVDGAAGQHDAVGTRGIRCPDDGAEVAGIAHLLADRDQASASRAKMSLTDVGVWRATAMTPCGRDRVGHRLEHLPR